MPNISNNAFNVQSKTISLNTFMTQTAIMMGLIAPDGNGELSTMELQIMQTVIQEAKNNYAHAFCPSLKILTQWENKFPLYPNSTDIILLNFSRAKIFEEYQAESHNLESPNTYNFPYNIMYIEKIRIFYKFQYNYFKTAYKVNRQDFENTWHTIPTYYVDYLDNVQQLWIKTKSTPQNVASIYLYGIFDEVQRDSENDLPSNYILSNDTFYGMPVATIEGLKSIVAYNTLVSLDMTPKEALTKKYLEACSTLNKAKAMTGISLG